MTSRRWFAKLKVIVALASLMGTSAAYADWQLTVHYLASYSGPAGTVTYNYYCGPDLDMEIGDGSFELNDGWDEYDVGAAFDDGHDIKVVAIFTPIQSGDPQSVEIIVPEGTPDATIVFNFDPP
jgi:hypothetical protein